MGKDLKNPEQGPGYVKHSDNHKEHGFGDGYYIGEWSTQTNKPHRRGIIIDSDLIRIGYFNNGDYGTGKHITIYHNSAFGVGE